MEHIARIGASSTINMKPASPVSIRAAGPLPENDWAAVDKLVAAQAKAAAALSAAAAAPLPPPKKAAGAAPSAARA